MITILYRPGSEHEREVLDFQSQLARNQVIVRLVNVDSRDGSTIARLYDVVEYPAVVAHEDDGRVIDTWAGKFPLISEVSYYAHA